MIERIKFFSLDHLGQIDAGEISEVKSYLQKVLKSNGSTRSLGSKAKIQQTQLIQQTRINYIMSLFQILSHLGQIDAGEISEVKSYLQKVLKSDGSTRSLGSKAKIQQTQLIQQTRINYIMSLFQILSHLGQIDAGEISEVKSYLQKVLKSDGSTGSLGSEAEIQQTQLIQQTRINYIMSLFQILSHLGQIDAGEISEVKSYLQKVLKSDGSTGSLGSEAEIQQTQLIKQTRINYVMSLFQILSHLGQIDAGEISEVKSYLQKVLKSDGSTGSLSSEPEINGTEENKNRVSTSLDLWFWIKSDTSI